MDLLRALLDPVQSSVFESLVLPALHYFGFMAYADDAYDATGHVVLAAVELLALYLLLRPLEAWRPVERWADRRGVRADVVYTLLERSGALPLLFFLVLQPLLGPFEIALRAAGYLPPNLEDVFPGLATQPLAAFLVYLIVIDFFEYWRHRFQHRFNWWWALHATHHSQRYMSFWADDRNHVLDSLIEALWLSLLALVIGVAPAQFVAIVFTMRLVENLSHANLRLSFGRVGERLLVSPRYHRVHHGIGVGHEGQARGCNFATLFPVWDVLFGTANFSPIYPATGIRDQLDGADYGNGFLDQQWSGMRRLWRALRPPRVGRVLAGASRWSR
ncbi:MAG: sterol desaturase family protein [Gammaproteobacteria bacterium]